MTHKFTKWDYRFIKLAEEIASWSTCFHAHVGCLIVKDNHILATGYNGAPKGMTTCIAKGYCYKSISGITKGPINCMAVHAEQNAICAAARFGVNIEGAIAYCTHRPCNACLKTLINSGIKKVIYKYIYEDKFAEYLIEDNDAIEIIQIGEQNDK